jgi:transposase InsO family protein
MREDNLLCLRKKRWIRTTDSAHGYRIYANLVQGITLTHPNQLWVADITYVRLVREFVYVAVILDAFSRRFIPLDLEVAQLLLHDQRVVQEAIYWFLLP